jgi:hypothetical protein
MEHLKNIERQNDCGGIHNHLPPIPKKNENIESMPLFANACHDYRICTSVKFQHDKAGFQQPVAAGGPPVSGGKALSSLVEAAAISVYRHDKISL